MRAQLSIFDSSIDVIETFTNSFHLICHDFQTRHIFSDISELLIFIFSNSPRSTRSCTFLFSRHPRMIFVRSPVCLLLFWLVRLFSKVDQVTHWTNIYKAFWSFFRESFNALFSLFGRTTSSLPSTHFRQIFKLSYIGRNNTFIYMLFRSFCCHQLQDLLLHHHICHLFSPKKPSSNGTCLKGGGLLLKYRSLEKLLVKYFNTMYKDL